MRLGPNSWFARLLYIAALGGLIQLGHYLHDSQVNPMFDGASVPSVVSQSCAGGTGCTTLPPCYALSAAAAADAPTPADAAAECAAIMAAAHGKAVDIPGLDLSKFKG